MLVMLVIMVEDVEHGARSDSHRSWKLLGLHKRVTSRRDVKLLHGRELMAEKVLRWLRWDDI